MACDLEGIVLSKLNPSITHPGPTKFGEDRHLNTWEEFGDKQANKQTLLEFYSSLRQQIKTTHLMQCGALYCEVNSEHEKVTALTDCLLRKS